MTNIMGGKEHLHKSIEHIKYDHKDLMKIIHNMECKNVQLEDRI